MAHELFLVPKLDKGLIDAKAGFTPGEGSDAWCLQLAMASCFNL